MNRDYLKSKIVQNQNLPPLVEQIKNFGNSVIANSKQILTGGSLKVDPSTASQRLDICKSCPFYIIDKGRCQKCGCYMSIKVTLTAESCPVKKW